MIEWPFYEVEFERGPVITVASAALGSAMIDALAIANEPGQAFEHDEALDYRMTDIVSVRQVGLVYISSSIERALTGERLDHALAQQPSEDSFFDEEVKRSGSESQGRQG